MSKRVLLAVIREATLNAKPTDTHYLAAGGLQIARRDAVALKGTTLYYREMVDLGEIRGGDFIQGRDIPVYLTDTDPVLVFQPQDIRFVDPSDVPVVVVAPAPVATQPIPEAASTEVKARRGRPPKNKQVSVEATEPPPPPEAVAEVPVESSEPAVPAQAVEPEPDRILIAQDDERSFLIEPTGAPSQPEFHFELDEDEEAPPPPVAQSTLKPISAEFEVEDEPTPEEPAPAKVKRDVPEQSSESSGNDDYSGVDTGMFDE